MRRHRWIAATLAPLALVLAAVALAACGDSTAAEDATGDAASRRGRAGGEWPMFRGDSSSTGVAQSDLPEQPALLWTYQAGGDIESTAAIAGGRVFVGSLDGSLHAIDLATGAPAWKFDAGAAVSAGWFSSFAEQAARANTAATRAMRFIDDLLRGGGVTGTYESGDPGQRIVLAAQGAREVQRQERVPLIPPEQVRGLGGTEQHDQNPDHAGIRVVADRELIVQALRTRDLAEQRLRGHNRERRDAGQEAEDDGGQLGPAAAADAERGSQRVGEHGPDGVSAAKPRPLVFAIADVVDRARLRAG